MKQLLLVSFMTILIGCGKKEDDPLPINPTIGPIDLISPNTTLFNNVETEITAKPSFIVKKIAYYVDGQSVGSSITSPYSIMWTPKNLLGGTHDLTIEVTLESGHIASVGKSINIKLRLGDEFMGGRIIDFNIGERTGLVVANSDLVGNTTNTFRWNKTGYVGAVSADGAENTKKMAASADQPYHAGYQFKNGLELNGYKDWYIPSSSELELMKQNRQYISNMPTVSPNAYYWSSTELSDNSAYALNFVALSGTTYTKENYSWRVRPIRKF